MLRHDEAFVEVVASAPQAVAPTGDALREREKKKVKAINFFR